MDQGELFARLAQMRDAASALRSSAARIRDSIENVETEIRALGPERFTSTAAEAFRSQYTRLTPFLREASQVLGQFEEKLISAADEIEIAAHPID
jgi:uncharacterized protein YukE